ncbi:helix-turn-helix transcriptional regulator [Arenicella chitinivorans]|nr:WYL domain-containing protein [Arenicella chitinivorans]
MAKTSFDTRTRRRQQLIGLLRSEMVWTSKDLRLELGVSQRTLMRELAGLRESGYPIESERGRGGGIRLNGRWGVERLTLDHQEVTELIFALTVMESLQSPLLTGKLKAIKQKLFLAFPSDQRAAVNSLRKRIMIGDSAGANVVMNYATPPQTISASLTEAFIAFRNLEIHYESEAGEPTSRIIEPHYILLKWPIWYVIAWDHLRDASRVFRIDRIRRARVCNACFKLRSKNQFNNLYTPDYPPI